MKHMKAAMKIPLLLLLCIALLLPGLTGCSLKSTPPSIDNQLPEHTISSDMGTPPSEATKTDDDIVVLFTGDVHGADDEAIGYAGLKALADSVEENITEHLTIVDTGDAIWGDFLSNQSGGTYTVELMNRVGYDYAVCGNHEFDYGMTQLRDLMEKSEATYLGCNITYTGEGENPLAGLQPYAIEAYGDTKVAYIGVTTPDSITDSAPITFQENGRFVYDFAGGNNGQELYTTVQTQVNEARKEGADHVILLTHLGDTEDYGVHSSEALIAATTGVDAVLDGHAHSTIPSRLLKNKEGKTVTLASTGTGLESVGMLTITPNGHISATLVSGMEDRDADIASLIAEANAEYEEILSEKLAFSDFELVLRDENGGRLVRNREMPIGNLLADAFRTSTGADIGIINGGGIRAPLPKGDITYGDILTLLPYGNNVCVVKATGQEIADALEFSAAGVMLDENGNPTGDSGAFLQVSGLQFKINAAIPSPVVLDENEMFAGVEGTRRVGDLQILTADGTYAPLDMSKTYTLASINFTLQQQGDGYTMFADNEYPISLGKFDYETLIEYLQGFEGAKIPAQYAVAEGRIRYES